MEKFFNLYSPLEAATDSTVAILWDKLRDMNVREYEIYVDGVLYGRTNNTDYTITKLIADNLYKVSVAAVLNDSKDIIKGESIEVRTRRKGKEYNVRDYGAIGDGVTLNTQAIQRAIDECDDYGMVYVPAGTYISGPLFLKSNMVRSSGLHGMKMYNVRDISMEDVIITDKK